MLFRSRRGDRRAATWQVLLTAFGLIGIITMFFWGLNNQRETAGEQTAATTPTPVTPQGGDTQQGQQQGQQPEQKPQQSSPTTGQGGGDDKSNQKDQPQTGGQKTNGPPADGNGQPAQRQSK